MLIMLRPSGTAALHNKHATDSSENKLIRVTSKISGHIQIWDIYEILVVTVERRIA